MSIPRISCVGLLLRTLYLISFPCLSNQVPQTRVLPQLWSCVEVSFGIISASLPSLTTLFLALLGKRPNSFRNNSVSFSGQRAAIIRVADFGRIMDVPDGNAYSQSLELRTRNANNHSVTNLFDGEGSILVTHRVDQVKSKRTENVRGADQIGVVANAMRWSV